MVLLIITDEKLLITLIYCNIVNLYCYVSLLRVAAVRSHFYIYIIQFPCIYIRKPRKWNCNVQSYKFKLLANGGVKSRPLHRNPSFDFPSRIVTENRFRMVRKSNRIRENAMVILLWLLYNFLYSLARAFETETSNSIIDDCCSDVIKN